MTCKKAQHSLSNLSTQQLYYGQICYPILSNRHLYTGHIHSSNRSISHDASNSNNFTTFGSIGNTINTFLTVTNPAAPVLNVNSGTTTCHSTVNNIHVLPPHQIQQRCMTELMLLGKISNYNENIQIFNIGSLEDVCPHCSALSFKKEKGCTKFNCCHHGKIKIPPLSTYPTELFNLLNNRTYLNNIRRYNMAFAFASFNTTDITLSEGGPYVYKIQGPVNITISNLHRHNSSLNNPRYSQLYIYDDHDSLDIRIQTSKLNPTIITTIQQIINQHNIYSKRYKTFRQVLHEHGQETYNVCLKFLIPTNLDPRRYNLPICGEVMVVIPNQQGIIEQTPSFMVHLQDNNANNKKQLVFIKNGTCDADPLLFPLLFPYGDIGYSFNMKLSTTSNKIITPLQYYSYRLSIRPNSSSLYILKAGRLYQHYLVNAFIVVETSRLKYLQLNQHKLRQETLQGIHDHLIDPNRTNFRLGTRVILPSSYTGHTFQ